MNKTLISFSIIILQFCSSLTFAGGPSVLQGPNGNTPVTYQNPNITVHVESGDLGTLLTNDEADILLKEAFDLWNTVSTSTVNLIFDDTDTRITVDINIENFADFIPKFNGDTSNSDDGLSPIVYDSNGEIIDAFFGGCNIGELCQSDLIVGFAASSLNIGSSFFNEGYVVINGKQLEPTELKLLITHEMGHFFGLDHSQANINNQETIFGFPSMCTTKTQDKYPVMYPFVCRNEETLHSDDISAISALYPATNINNNFGILQGRFTDETGNVILGANIWAENITTGETVSMVSDYLKQGTGFYQLHLPAGNYTLHANSINILFNDGSSVGPYASSIVDVSFKSPHPITAVTYQGTTEGSDEIITISTSQTLNIDFSITGNDVVIKDNSATSKRDSKILGATSFITLLFLFSLLLTARRLDNYLT